MPDDPSVELPDVEELRLVRNGAMRTAKLTNVRPGGDAYLVTFEGIGDRDLVRDQLTGAVVLVPKSTIAEAKANEAYVFELVGAAVHDDAGNVLGTVGAVLAGAGQDLLSIDTPQGERLLPMVPDTLRGFDKSRRVLTVVPIPGLWE
jgi:16S rRNA processing protein RimM